MSSGRPAPSPLPLTARIREVGPRDGFQNEPEVIPTETKVKLIDALARTGLTRLEITSFVRPDVIPQLADAAEVLQAVDIPDEVSRSVLIPNERGLERALELRDRFDEINVFMSASETHNRATSTAACEESLTGLERVLARAREAGLRCEGVISVAFGCPYEGVVPPERVFEIAERLVAAGAQEIGFGDTTGMANPVRSRSSSPPRASASAAPRTSSSPPTSTTPAARGWPTSTPRWSPGSTRSSRASASWAAARCRRARPATSPPRTSSRCCTRWASRPASTCAR